MRMLFWLSLIWLLSGLIVGCTRVANNTIDASQPQPKLHGKKEVQQRQQAMQAPEAIAHTRAEVHCELPWLMPVRMARESTSWQGQKRVGSAAT